MANVNPNDLRLKGHQPCNYLDHIQGTDCADWQCPQCKEKYCCSKQAYCPDCMEPLENMERRLTTLRARKIEREKSLEYIIEEIEILENLTKS